MGWFNRGNGKVLTEEEIAAERAQAESLLRSAREKGPKQISALTDYLSREQKWKGPAEVYAPEAAYEIMVDLLVRPEEAAGEKATWLSRKSRPSSWKKGRERLF